MYTEKSFPSKACHDKLHTFITLWQLSRFPSIHLSSAISAYFIYPFLMNIVSLFWSQIAAKIACICIVFYNVVYIFVNNQQSVELQIINLDLTNLSQIAQIIMGSVILLGTRLLHTCTPANEGLDLIHVFQTTYHFNLL